MKRLLAILSSVCLLLAGFLPARAQSGSELERFQEAAGDRSILFRGKQASRYVFLANGNPYWESSSFGHGDLLCEGNEYHDLPLNIDAHKQRILVQLASGLLAASLTPSQVPSFTIDGHRFVGIGPGEDLPEGIYEIFGSGPEHVYKHVHKQLTTSTNNVNGETIGYYDPDYRTDVTRYFARRITYYFRDAEGTVSRFRGKSSLLRKFPGRRKEIRQALQEARLDQPGTSLDSFCEAVLNLTAR